MAEEKRRISEIGQLKEKIRQSGFPLEVEVASYLYSANLQEKLRGTPNEMYEPPLGPFAYMHGISMGAYYLDKDKSEGRELDIKLPIEVRYPGSGPSRRNYYPGLVLNLLIQCKRVPGNAWVFFKTSEKTLPPAHPCCTSALDSLAWSRSYCPYQYVSNLHFVGAFKATVRHEYVLDKNKSNKKDDNLFESVITLAKATSYEKECSCEKLKSKIDSCSSDLPGWTYQFFAYGELFYPIIVFDGKMFVAEMTQEYGKMNVVPIDQVCLHFDYVSGSYDIDLYIDIVKREAFREFFDSIIQDINVFKKAVVNDTGLTFRKEVEKAFNWYMEKRAPAQ